MSAYYNENDKYAVAWLRELIKAGLIADGQVDERSIELVRPDDVRGFTQCHFFAGIGGWSYALRLAGWPDDRAVWTGSCPCQPWSSAGAALGEDDPRHLWPVWFQLIRQCRPAIVFGEQVASKDGLYWLDLVYGDLETEDYAVGAVDLSGASLGAPDIRPRLWFVADADRERHARERLQLQRGEPREHQPEALRGGEVGSLADLDEFGRGSSRRPTLRRESDAAGRRATDEFGDSDSAGLQASGTIAAVPNGREPGGASESTSAAGELADGAGARCASGRPGEASDGARRGTGAQSAGLRHAGLLGSVWADAEWLPCTDGKWRPVEPGTFPLASGVPARVGRLRGYGNSIKPQVAQVFIEAYCEVRGL